MTHSYNEKRSGLIAATIIFSAAILICAFMINQTIVKVKSYNNRVSVTGAAYKPITSDYAVWEGSFSAFAPLMNKANEQLKHDLQKVESFMQNEGFVQSQYKISAVRIRKSHDREGNLKGFNLSRSIRLESDNVEQITALAERASSLIDEGVEFYSDPPRYLFTGLDTLKLEMIEAATKNAKLRAELLVETSGQKVGAPISARVGVFQIRAMHSNEVSSMGISDIYSIEKEIVSTVHISFLID